MGVWYTYILQSEVTGNLYTGVTPNPESRLQKHNDGTGAKYTRAGRPWKMVYLHETLGKSEALKEEYAIKRLSRTQKLSLIQETQGGRGQTTLRTKPLALEGPT